MNDKSLTIKINPPTINKWDVIMDMSGVERLVIRVQQFENGTTITLIKNRRFKWGLFGWVYHQYLKLRYRK